MAYYTDMDISQFNQSQNGFVLSNTALRSNLPILGQRLALALPISTIDLIPLQATETVANLKRLYPTDEIFACDFYIQSAEAQKLSAYGLIFETDFIHNVDHHAPLENFYKFVSSGNLAAEFVKLHGPVPTDTKVVISHTDCDSVISSLIIRGLIPPDKVFTDAVIAADHTGAENPIADLLQALDYKRDINFSARNLALLLQELPLEPKAQQLLNERMAGRVETQAAVKNGNYSQRCDGKLVVLEIVGDMRNEFMPALFPEAVIILTHEKSKMNNVIRARLGLGAPSGFTLNSINIRDLDPAYGGRWNAGANRRGGGTSLPLSEYFERFESLLKEALSC